MTAPNIFTGLHFADQEKIAPILELVKKPVEATKCNKRNCYFCEVIFAKPRPKPKVRLFMKKTSYSSLRWSERDLMRLKAYINFPTMKLIDDKIIENRTFHAVQTMQSFLRKKYGIKPLPRTDTGYRK